MKRQYYDPIPGYSATDSPLKQRRGADDVDSFSAEIPGSVPYTSIPEGSCRDAENTSRQHSQGQKDSSLQFPTSSYATYPLRNYASLRSLVFPKSGIDKKQTQQYESRQSRQYAQHYSRNTGSHVSGPPNGHYSGVPFFPNPGLGMPLPLISPLNMRFNDPSIDPFRAQYCFDEEPEVEEKILTTGHWSRKEECILLTLVKSMINYELKVIAQAAWDCSIHRNSRAVDKKLKRLIHYQTWKDRSRDEVLKRIDKILDELTYKLSEAETELVNSVIAKYTHKSS